MPSLHEAAQGAQEAIVQHRELSSALCDDLGVGQGGREFDKERDICIQ